MADSQLGVCLGAQQSCINGEWLNPSYFTIEGFQDIDQCRNNLDDDCDGIVDEASCLGVCGDGVIDPNEECDDGVNNTSTDCIYGDVDCNRCSEQCQRFLPQYCGDGIINGIESCESDQLDQGILCTHECITFDCGGDALEYTAMRIQGWAVCVANQLISQHPQLYQDVINALDEDLEYILLILPINASQWLKRINIWVEVALAQFPGGVYHPNPVWLAQNGYPEEWALGIQIGNAQNYMTWVREQPAIILHELSHAWHHQMLGYNYQPIINAYQTAIDQGIYDSVQYIYGQFLPAYAATNNREYFAELTEAWFWSNDYYPFNRQELQSHDMLGASVVESAWQME